jgi:hypothetical protein
MDMPRKSKQQLKLERAKQKSCERSKRYYNKQRQTGKVRLVKWTTPEQKQFLEEFIFPDLQRLTERYFERQTNSAG